MWCASSLPWMRQDKTGAHDAGVAVRERLLARRAALLERLLAACRGSTDREGAAAQGDEFLFRRRRSATDRQVVRCSQDGEKRIDARAPAANAAAAKMAPAGCSPRRPGRGRTLGSTLTLPRSTQCTPSVGVSHTRAPWPRRRRPRGRPPSAACPASPPPALWIVHGREAAPPASCYKRQQKQRCCCCGPHTQARSAAATPGCLKGQVVSRGCAAPPPPAARLHGLAEGLRLVERAGEALRLGVLRKGGEAASAGWWLCRFFA